jgi:hypothetical protein
MKTFHGDPPEVIVRLTWGVVIPVAALAFIVAFHFLNDMRGEIKFAAAVVGGAAAIFSAYYAGIALYINLYRERQKRAYEIIYSFNNPDSVRARVAIDNELKKTSSDAIDFNAIVVDEEKHASVRHLLGVLEDLAIGVKSGYADEAVLFCALNYLVVKYYDALKMFIDAVRTTRNNKLLYTDLEGLAANWKKDQSYINGERLAHNF